MFENTGGNMEKINIKGAFFEWLIYFVYIMIYLKLAFLWKDAKISDNHFVAITIVYLFGLLQLNRIIRRR